jgi:hypothetical protein
VLLLPRQEVLEDVLPPPLLLLRRNDVVEKAVCPSHFNLPLPIA